MASLKKATVVALPVIIIAAITAFVLMFSPLIFGVNKLGERTVIQYPWGGKTVKFDNGWYFQGFGAVTEYSDFLTYDFTTGKVEGATTLDTEGINVRYRDGGTGTIYGKARFGLPNDEESMLKLHRAFKSQQGVAAKLIQPVVESSMNLTAGLLTSEGAYAEERGRFIELASSQVRKGRIKTRLKREETKDPVTGEIVIQNIPVPFYDKTGGYIFEDSDLFNYGIADVNMQITQWGFEKKTLDQVAEKRSATMRIITSKAEAEAAKQEAKTIEEKGKAQVTKAQYEAKVLKEQAVVNAEREKEVAEVKAAQRVAVAEQAKLEAEQKKLAAAEYKEEQILIGEGEAARKRLIVDADGALEQKLEAYIRVNEAYAREFGKQKLVPEITFGSDSGVTDSGSMDLLKMLTAKTAKDLALDMSIGKENTTK